MKGETVEQLSDQCDQNIRKNKKLFQKYDDDSSEASSVFLIQKTVYKIVFCFVFQDKERLRKLKLEVCISIQLLCF